MCSVFHVGCSHMQDMGIRVNTETGVAGKSMCWLKKKKKKMLEEV